MFSQKYVSQSVDGGWSKVRWRRWNEGRSDYLWSPWSPPSPRVTPWSLLLWFNRLVSQYSHHNTQNIICTKAQNGDSSISKIEETHRRGKIVLVVQEAKHSIKGVVRRKLEHAGLNSILAASIQCIVYISILLPLHGRLYKVCVRKCEHRVSVCNLMCVF